MSMDLFALNALSNELNTTLSGARVNKIVQPENDEIRLHLRKENKNYILVISANPKVPRCHITQQKKTNPQNAPSFCMLLRKYLAISSLEKISVFNNDRILKIDFNCKTELNDFKEYSLIVELMGRYSNIIFIDSDIVIVDALKKSSLDSPHPIMKKFPYSPVAQPRLCLFSENFMKEFSRLDGNLFDNILDNFSGYSKNTLIELFRLANVDISSSDKKDIPKLCEKIKEMQNINNTQYFSPCMQNGEVLCFPYKNKEGEKFQTLSMAFDSVTTKNDLAVRVKSKTKYLSVATNRLITKLKKNISIYHKKIEDCLNMDEEKIIGELITTNIYKIKKGMDNIRLLNYYTNENITITLDPQLSPSQNAKLHYDKYNKMKRTKEFLSSRIIEKEAELQYAISINESIKNLKNDDSLIEIEDELIKLHALKITNKRSKQDRPQPPIEYEVNGFTILKGKNNIQNDKLTFKIANGNDIWLHEKNAPSAHTIILTRGKTVDDDTLKIAAEIAICDKDANREVDYTLRQFVKKRQPYHYGQVLYTDFKTISATPNEHIEFLKIITNN